KNIFFYFQAEDGIRDFHVTGVQTCALPILHECPWERLQKLRKAMSNTLLQMLFRGSNAVGYSAYPKNIIGNFIEEAWKNGIDILDRKSTRLNSSHVKISYAVFCLKKKK